MDHGLCKAGCVVFDTKGLSSFVEVEFADAVDFAESCNGERGCLRGGGGVAVQNVKLCHKLMIAAGCGAIQRLWQGGVYP